MDSKVLLVELAAVIDKLEHVIDDFSVQLPNWESLDWSSSGARSLFTEFKRIGSWSEYAMAELQKYELTYYRVSRYVLENKLAIDARRRELIATKAKSWITMGYAYTEREHLVIIEIGEAAVSCIYADQQLDIMYGLLGVLKGKVKQLSNFRADARAASSMMNFGNTLGELR